MAIRRKAIEELSKYLDAHDLWDVVQLAKQQDQDELKAKIALKDMWEDLTDDVIESLIKEDRIKDSAVYQAILDFLLQRTAKSMRDGMKSAERQVERLKSTKIRAAKLPRVRTPRSFKDLMALWDKWRKGERIPKRHKVLANRIKAEYLKKIKSYWVRHSEDFRSGNADGKAEIRKKIQEVADTTYSRAKMITETETTSYYNEARRRVYDQSPDITHYLFIAIRDSATTKWCKSRDMVVFTKGTELLEKNTPACHWNCRSEILPLSPLNPSHLKLINDLSRRAENRKLVPLPRGWKSG